MNFKDTFSTLSTLSFDPKAVLPGVASWMVAGLSTLILFSLLVSSDKILTGFHYAKTHQHLEQLITHNSSLSLLLDDEYVKRMPLKEIKEIELTLDIHNLIEHKEFSRSYKVLDSGKLRETPLIIHLKTGLKEIEEIIRFEDEQKRIKKELRKEVNPEVKKVLTAKCLSLAKKLIKEVALPEVDPLSEFYFNQFQLLSNNKATKI